MKKVLTVYKNIGETPLECLERIRSERQELVKERLSYAGRLDPMAEGVMLILVGDENKEREKYLGLDKEYRVTILFGMETDTYDVLGLVTSKLVISKLEKSQIQKTLGEFKGKIMQKYPPYSSRTVNGKPLFVWAREGRIHEIEIPEHEIEIYSIEINNFEEIQTQELKKIIDEKLSKVHGDFRQEEIKKDWNDLFAHTKNESWQTVTITVYCSSGAYMRSIAHEVGQKLRVGAIALHIVRTRIGETGL